MLISSVLVALGGAIGALCRFLMGHLIVRNIGDGFPVAILSVNVLGSFVMGLLAVWLGQRFGAGSQLFFMTGILGGFTTFSAFSLEAVTLIEKGAWGQAGLYVSASVGLSIAALFAGVVLARMALS